MNRYNNIPILRTPAGKRYRANTKYPEIPFNNSDIYVIAEQGDRFDLLASQYYGDTSLWWIIPAANPRFKPNSIYPERGHQIRIPANISGIIEAYNVLNK
jgi:hypothetical protein